MSAPERIFAKLDTATVYMDGSSPLVARTREFRGSTAYLRADITDVMLAALKHAAANMSHPDQMIDEAIAKSEGKDV